jgi:hypothetical protein
MKEADCIPGWVRTDTWRAKITWPRNTCHELIPLFKRTTKGWGGGSCFLRSHSQGWVHPVLWGNTFYWDPQESMGQLCHLLATLRTALGQGIHWQPSHTPNSHPVCSFYKSLPGSYYVSGSGMITRDTKENLTSFVRLQSNGKSKHKFILAQFLLWRKKKYKGQKR